MPFGILFVCLIIRYLPQSMKLSLIMTYINKAHVQFYCFWDVARVVYIGPFKFYKFKKDDAPNVLKKPIFFSAV